MDDDEFSVFNISFAWFSVIGAGTVFLVGTFVSHLTGGYDRLDIKLISQVAHWLVPKEIREIELREMTRQSEIGEGNDSIHIYRSDSVK